MTPSSLRGTVLLVATLLLVVGCASNASTPDPLLANALSSFIVWSPVAFGSSVGVDGAVVDTVSVQGGQIVRIQTRDDHPLRVAERIRSGAGFSESWSTKVPEHGVLFLRAGALTDAFLLPRGAGLLAHLGHGSDPGYAWFDLEGRVVAWANGPLPAAFPRIATPERIDYAGFAALDRILADAVTGPSREADRAAARAVRVVTGLRAVRALRPDTGLPYFFDEPVVPTPPTRHDLRGSEIEKGHPLQLQVTGPAILHLSLQSPVDGNEAAQVEVLERANLRARIQLSALRPSRALVHVPPGMHRYRVESAAATLVSATLARPNVHVEEAKEWDEDSQLKRAKRACEVGGAVPICALALDLLGALDERPPPLSTRDLTSDRAVLLSRAASAGDPDALRALGQGPIERADAETRAAWVHAMTHGTTWRVLDGAANGQSWTSVESAHDAQTTCAAQGVGEIPDVLDTIGEYETTLWHGVPVVELIVLGRCDDALPIELDVDGQRLVGNPSAALVHWRVRVRGATAKIRRLDHGSARVIALPSASPECSLRWLSMQAPELVSSSPTLRFEPDSSAVGVELWLRAGARLADVRVTALGASSSNAAGVHVLTPRGPGPTAYDPNGQLWTRVARVALPSWAGKGVRVSGGADVAVRAIARVPRPPARASAGTGASSPSVTQPSEEELTLLTRRILETPNAERGLPYLTRGLRLAVAGASNAALSDAHAAASLHASGPNQEDPVELVVSALRRRAIHVDPLPEGVSAYGIDADFDAGTQRCQASAGPRSALDHSFAKAATLSGASFDLDAALQAAALHERLPLDPRSHLLLTRSLNGSRWRLRETKEGGEQRVRSPRETRKEGPIDGLGKLRPRVAVGGVFVPGSYATVLPARSASAVVAATASNPPLHIELACAARDPAHAVGLCPIDVTYDGAHIPLRLDQAGRGSASLPVTHIGPKKVNTSLRDEPGDWVALVRLIADRPIPGGVQVGDTAWAIVPPNTESRISLRPGPPLTLHFQKPTLLRIEARAETLAASALVLVASGRERRVALPEDSTLISLAPGELTLTATGGTVSLTLAERIAAVSAGDPIDASISASDRPAKSPIPSLRIQMPDSNAAGWQRNAIGSPAPLTPFHAALGTLVAETGVVYGNLHPSPSSDAWHDAYAFGLAGYRRRIESLGLWTRADVFSRIRTGEPSHGFEGALYEDLDRQHLRLTVTLVGETQRVAGIRGNSLRSHGFVEYSYRATPNLFILPRLGYDGMYSTIKRRPTALAFVDDEVYSPYRSRRPTFIFVQGLFWYAPYFNEILYLRVRGTVDAKARAFSHSAAATGAFLAFGELNLSAQVQGIWYVPRDSLSGQAHVETSVAASARYSLWSDFGSFAVIPGLSAEVRPRDLGFQVVASVDLLASYRRGLRDFSSLELDFPEQLSGGIPWRGSTPGAYR